MNPLFIIDIKNGSQFYALFYFFAFLTGLFILIWEGRKRKFPTVPWLLVITTAFLFFMIGTQAIKFSSADWQRVFQFQDLENNNGRSVLGGILFAIPGLLLAKYFFKFRYNLMDAFAWAAPLGIVIQRFGCLMAGCCYGTPTSAPWGIQYGAYSHAFTQHVNQSLIPVTDHLSLAIHPVALYEILGCVLVIVILHRIRRYIHVSGNLFLASLGLYAIVRFFVEFFRAASLGITNTTGLSIVQLIILIIIPVVIGLIIYRERNTKAVRETGNQAIQSERLALPGFLIISILFVIVSRWLTPLEIITLNLVMLPTLLFITWQMFKKVTIPSMRLITLSLMAGSMVMMSQTLPETSPRDSTKRSYNILSIGTLTGTSDFRLNDVTYDCDGNPTSTSAIYDLKNSFQINGAGYTRVEEQGYGKVIQYGIDAYWGTHKENVVDLQNGNPPVVSSNNIMGFHPYVQYDWPLLAAGIGVHVGNLTILSIPTVDYSTLTPSSTSLKKINGFPSAYFRVGYVDRFFGELKLAQQFPTPFPSTSFQTNVGFGFRKYNGGAVRIGTTSYNGLFISPTIPIGKHILIESYLGGLPSFLAPVFATNADEVDHQASFVGSISLRYKFGFNTKK
jgi:prolipoprotein diacylglyceryltransferase